MAYTICDMHGNPKPLRLLLTNSADEPRVGESFTPYWWVCDPCNPTNRRYEITFGCDYQPQGYPWYQVVTSDDTAEDISAKLEHYRAVIAARKAMDEARRQWERLNG